MGKVLRELTFQVALIGFMLCAGMTAIMALPNNPWLSLAITMGLFIILPISAYLFYVKRDC